VYVYAMPSAAKRRSDMADEPQSGDLNWPRLVPTAAIVVQCRALGETRALGPVYTG